jgi:DNA repair protein RadC
MDIRVFDHLIIGDGRYFSFPDKEWIEKYQRQTIF